jgi:shikimate dehydrogenase
MHMAAYRALGMDHTYGAIRATAEDLPRLVEALRSGVYDGFNVTVPHKARVLRLVDRVDASATKVDAVNTLVRMFDGAVVAFNTDVPALEAELLALAPERSIVAMVDSTAIVLGSGGAARAAAAALAGLGVKRVFLRSRREGTLAPTPLDREALTVVQATSAGMTGADPGDAVAAAIDWAALPAGAVALDVVYAPPETPFLAAALARGLRCANGLGMLARQGALALAALGGA